MKKMVYLACLTGIALASGCSETKKEAAPVEEKKIEAIVVKKINAEELKEKKVKNKDLLVINALDEKTYAECHIKGSINVPVEKIAEKSKDWKKDAEIVVYCAGPRCNAAEKASEALTVLGFTNIFEFKGGMEEWKEKKFDLEGKCAVEPIKEQPMK